MLDERLLSISALQHYAYCPRQFALIHVEQVWNENRFTAEGKILHERVDSGVAEQRGEVRSERGVMLRSERFKLIGKMDLLEVEKGSNLTYRPVEYKRGKPKVQDWDRIQLCAQAICLEEMRQIVIEDGAIWYWEVRHREIVSFDTKLREAVVNTINGAHQILSQGITPAPIDDSSRCRGCSLINQCEPKAFRSDKTPSYIQELLNL